MADIQGIVDDEQLKAMMDAGYLVEEVGDQPDDKRLHRVSVWVECDINDLLTPPLCKVCGTLMDHECFPIATMLYTCPDCGEQVRIIRISGDHE